MIYRRSLFSARRFRSKPDGQDELSDSSVLPVASGTGNQLPVNPEAILDSFTYLLSSPSEVTLRKLQEIFEKVRSPEVRLCLRAHGQLTQLLRCLCEEGPGDDPSMRLLRFGCLHFLSLDAFSAAQLLETCCQSLIAAVDAPAKEGSEDRVPGLAGKAAGTLKRRRVQGSTAGTGHPSVYVLEEVHGHVARCLQQEEPRFLELVEPSSGVAGTAVRSISLLILWRCLGNLPSDTAKAELEVLWSWFPGVLQGARGVSSELLWEALERLARNSRFCQKPGQLLDASRQTLSDVSVTTGCQQSCLRACHALVTFGDESLAPLFTNEMLQLLVGRCHSLNLAGSSASLLRSVLGLLANLASCGGEHVCKELSEMRAEDHSFSLALAKSLAWYKEQEKLSDESLTLEVEVHLNYAMASLLLGWLARGSSTAKAHLEDQLGSTEALLDILRTFTIFQDRCGILTDGSLVCVHTVMQFLAEADGETAPPENPDGMQLEIPPLEMPSGQLNLIEPTMSSAEISSSLQMEVTPSRMKSEGKATSRHIELTPKKEVKGTPMSELTPSLSKTKREMELTPRAKTKATVTKLTPSRPKTQGKAMELTSSGCKGDGRSTLKQLELTPSRSKRDGTATLKQMQQNFSPDVVQVYQRRRGNC